MKTKEFKQLLTKLDVITKHTSLSTVFDDIINFFDIVNYINDNITKTEINKISIKGRKGFLFIKPDLDYTLSETCRDMMHNALLKASRDIYGMNRNLTSTTSKHTTYCGNINGIWTNTVWFFEHEANEETRKQIAYQLYSYIKSFNNKFNPEWIR